MLPGSETFMPPKTTEGVSALEKVLEGLYASDPMSPDFAPTSFVRAFLLQRPRGNLLLYSSTTVRASDQRVRELGGIDRHYLSHWHEAGFGAAEVGAPVYVNAADREEAAKQCPIAGTFEGRQMLEEGIEIIPNPGHTPGSTAFLVEIAGKRCLFTGDSIWLRKDAWSTAVLPTSDREAYLESLEMLRGIEFDLLIPSFANKERAFVEPVDAATRDRNLAALVEHVRQGAGL